VNTEDYNESGRVYLELADATLAEAARDGAAHEAGGLKGRRLTAASAFSRIRVEPAGHRAEPLDMRGDCIMMILPSRMAQRRAQLRALRSKKMNAGRFADPLP
jgi:hypothetical protein